MILAVSEVNSLVSLFSFLLFYFDLYLVSQKQTNAKIPGLVFSQACHQIKMNIGIVLESVSLMNSVAS